MKDIRPIAIYLPQFHPIRENDEWWGKGFTEWTNVSSSRPRFRGHYQPHLPSDLGFYDLRLPEVRQAQAELAKSYGVHGFCYYHYWFNGRRILERPFNEVYKSGQPDFPFMLCWANENWTRVWDGGEHAILLKQEYSPEDDVRHITALIPYFKDKRYIRVGDRPVFAIYKDSLFPDIRQTLATFREHAARSGLNLYICKFDRSRDSSPETPESLGFDAAIDFQPLSRSWDGYQKMKMRSIVHKVGSRIQRLMKAGMGKRGEVDRITDMEEFVNWDIAQPDRNYKLFPGVCPSWDNSSRRSRRSAIIFKNSSPDVFEKWVAHKVNRFQPYSKEENFLFINAWNEWAEGNHLEPDMKHGLGYLEALKRSLGRDHG